MSKNIVITGTSSGVGLSLAVLCAKRGHNVFATMRDLEKSQSLIEACHQAQVEVHLKQLDVTSSQSVSDCIQSILSECDHIDCLVNNAGAGFVRSTEQANESEIHWAMDVNFMGVVRTTKAVISSMRERRSGHIINITSVGGLVGQPFNEIYCAAKFAVEGYTESMASYIQPSFNVKFTAIEPGGIRSEFANNIYKYIENNGGMHNDEYQPIMNRYIKRATTRSTVEEDSPYQTPEQVAEVIANCIESESPPIRLRTSEWAERFCELKTQSDPDGSKLQQNIVNALL